MKQSFLLFFQLFAFSKADQFELFFSQWKIPSPCTGSIVTFDFGRLLLNVFSTTNPLIDGLDVLGTVTLNSTVRYEGQLWQHNSFGQFSFQYAHNDSFHNVNFFFPYDPISFIDQVQFVFDTQMNAFTTTFQDVQVEKC
jgi:hypothetical protein